MIAEGNHQKKRKPALQSMSGCAFLIGWVFDFTHFDIQHIALRRGFLIAR